MCQICIYFMHSKVISVGGFKSLTWYYPAAQHPSNTGCAGWLMCVHFFMSGMWMSVYFEKSTKLDGNPLDLDPKELCVTDAPLFIIPSRNFYFFPSLKLKKENLHTFVPLLNDYGFREPRWKWGEDIYIFGANPFLMRPGVLNQLLFYLWIWHVGFEGVNYGSVLGRQLSAPP